MNEPWNKGIAEAAEAIGREMEERKARGWPFGAYGDALNLLKAMEDRLTTRKAVPLKRFILVPLYLWFRGLEQITISYGRLYAFSFGLGIAGLFFSGLLPPNIQPRAEQATLLLNLFAAFTLVFAAPSTYCSAGTNEKHVSTITGKLFEWKIKSAARVDLILKDIKVFEERVKRRLVIFRWFLGVGWAMYFSPMLADAIKIWNATGASFPKLASLFQPFAFLVGFYVLVEAYARGVDILFRCIELGCNEHLASIDMQTKEKDKQKQ